MLLQVKNVQVHYQKAEALKGVCLDVGEGEIVTIIGSNGAGKTTTLKSIAGLVHLSHGEIWFDGERVDKRDPEPHSQDGAGPRSAGALRRSSSVSPDFGKEDGRRREP